MRVFVTGASGHVGSAVVPELLRAGHQVSGLARSDASAATLESWGADVVRGSLDDPDGLAAAAAQADGVIHLAFNHEWMRTGSFMDAINLDLTAIQAMGAALEGTDKPYVTTSGTMMLLAAGVTGRAGTEQDFAAAGPRVDAENYVVALADKGVRSSTVRLPPTVHSDLDKHGFVPTLIGFARQHGKAGYIGDGANHWCAGHTRDAARVYRLALEQGPAGSRWHAVGDEGVPFKQIAEAIGRGLDVPAESIPQDELESFFGFLAGFAGADNVVSSAYTQQTLGWTPSHPGLIEDMALGHYFES